MMTKVKHPSRRYDMLGCLEELSDFNMQKRAWVKSDHPCGFWASMSYSREFLLDDYPFDEWEPGPDCLGYILDNEKEGHLLKKISILLRRVGKELGRSQPDSVYLNSPLWQEVVQAAKEAYDYIMTYEDMDDLLRQCQEESDRDD